MPSTLAFKSRFWSQIIEGTKTQTIRKKPKCWPGDIIVLKLEGGASSHKAICIGLQEIAINNRDVLLKPMSLMTLTKQAEFSPTISEHEFARKEGFQDLTDLHHFIDITYGMPFEGFLISFALLENEGDKK